MFFDYIENIFVKAALVPVEDWVEEIFPSDFDIPRFLPKLTHFLVIHTFNLL